MYQVSKRCNRDLSCPEKKERRNPPISIVTVSLPDPVDVNAEDPYGRLSVTSVIGFVTAQELSHTDAVTVVVLTASASLVLLPVATVLVKTPVLFLTKPIARLSTLELPRPYLR